VTGWIAALALAIVAAAVGAVFGASRERRGAAEKLDAIRDELSRRLNEVFSLQELSYVLSESVQPERIAEQIANYVFRFLEVDGVLVGLTTDGGGTIRAPAAVGSLAGLLGRELGEAEGGLLSAAMGGERMELAERDGEHQP